MDVEDSKKITKKKRKKPSIETHRFELSLEIHDDSGIKYPEFNWLDLMDKKRALETKEKDGISPTSSDNIDNLLAYEIDDMKIEETPQKSQKTKTKKGKILIDGTNKQFDIVFCQIDEVMKVEEKPKKIQKKKKKLSKKTGEIALFNKGRIAKNVKTKQGGFYVKERSPKLEMIETDSDSDVEILLARLMSESMVATEEKMI